MTDFVRIALVRRARALRREIFQILDDQECYNAATPKRAPIDVDADGKLRAIAVALDAMLAGEDGGAP